MSAGAAPCCWEGSQIMHCLLSSGASPLSFQESNTNLKRNNRKKIFETISADSSLENVLTVVLIDAFLPVTLGLHFHYNSEALSLSTTPFLQTTFTLPSRTFAFIIKSLTESDNNHLFNRDKLQCCSKKE